MSLLEDGIRQSDIAREFGVSRQYVNKLAKQGGHESVINLINENLPWELPMEYRGNHLYQALRLTAHLNYDPEGMTSKANFDKIGSLIRKLTVFNQVLDFDPDYPAVPRISNTPGFAFIPRTETDKNYMIKIRPGVKITKLGEKLWRLPQNLPKE